MIYGVFTFSGHNAKSFVLSQGFACRLCNKTKSVFLHFLHLL